MKTLQSDYDLYPSDTAVTDEARITGVKTRANDLLCNSGYLHGEPDALVCQTSFLFLLFLTCIRGESKQLRSQGTEEHLSCILLQQYFKVHVPVP